MKSVLEKIWKFIICLVVYISFRIVCDWLGASDALGASLAGGFMVGTMYELGLVKPLIK